MLNVDSYSASSIDIRIRIIVIAWSVIGFCFFF